MKIIPKGETRVKILKNWNFTFVLLNTPLLLFNRGPVAVDEGGEAALEDDPAPKLGPLQQPAATLDVGIAPHRFATRWADLRSIS